MSVFFNQQTLLILQPSWFLSPKLLYVLEPSLLLVAVPQSYLRGCLPGLSPQFVWLCCAACEIYFPDQRLNLGPQQWERRVLTTGLPGNSQVLSVAHRIKHNSQILSCTFLSVDRELPKWPLLEEGAVSLPLGPMPTDAVKGKTLTTTDHWLHSLSSKHLSLFVHCSKVDCHI